jgi:hypothetical protein
MVGQVFQGPDGGPRVVGVCYRACTAIVAGIQDQSGRVGLNYMIN